MNIADNGSYVKVVLKSFEIDPNNSNIVTSDQTRYTKDKLVDSLTNFSKIVNERPMYCETHSMFRHEFERCSDRNLAFQRFCDVNEKNVVAVIEQGSFQVSDDGKAVMVTAKVKSILPTVDVSKMSFGIRCSRQIRIADLNGELYGRCVTEVNQIITWDVISNA